MPIRFIPRVCGEHAGITGFDSTTGGSSPRMRGTCFPTSLRHPYIPVHPRVCGEHIYIGRQYTCQSGSSPRMRGTCPHSALAREVYRFIPAYAGNILDHKYHVHVEPVHPRVCGEHFIVCLYALHQNGSSPRMRGTFSKQFLYFYWGRFIPAYAGNMRSFSSTILLNSVHPRVCGEHFCPFRFIPNNNGSSPRMRGT